MVEAGRTPNGSIRRARNDMDRSSTLRHGARGPSGACVGRGADLARSGVKPSAPSEPESVENGSTDVESQFCVFHSTFVSRDRSLLVPAAANQHAHSHRAGSSFSFFSFVKKVGWIRWNACAFYRSRHGRWSNLETRHDARVGGCGKRRARWCL